MIHHCHGLTQKNNFKVSRVILSPPGKAFSESRPPPGPPPTWLMSAMIKIL